MTETLKVLGIAGLLAFVIWMGKNKVWVYGWQLAEADIRWAKQLLECEARAAAAIAAAERREQEWKDMARQAVPLASAGLQAAKERRP